MAVAHLIVALALTADPGLHQAAKKLYAQAGAAFAAGRYAEAATEFKAAYALEAIPGLLFDVGQCDRKLGRWDEALAYFRRYLSVKPDAANRAVVELRIAEAERNVRESATRGRVTLPHPGPPVESPSGIGALPHPGPPPQAGEGNGIAGGPLPRMRGREGRGSTSIPTPAVTAAPASAVTASEATAESDHRSAAPAWILAGGGVAAVAGGILLGQAALGAQLHEVSGQTVTAYTRSEAAAANARGYVGQGLIVGGVALAAAGLVWMLVR